MNKYVLVKSYYGLGGDLCVMLGGLHHSRVNQRQFVVDWDGGLYGGQGKKGGLFNHLFRAPTVLSLSDLPKNIESTYPAHWKEYVFSPPLTYVAGVPLAQSRPEDVPESCDSDCVVITRDSSGLRNEQEIYYALAKELEPNEDVGHRVLEITRRLNEYKKSIGIHFRHGNGERRVIPPDPLWFRNRINQYLKENELCADEILLLVSTDCGAVVEYFKRYYKNCLDVQKNYIKNGAGALHINRDDLTDAQKIEMAQEALVDMYSLAKTDYFVGSGGYFSRFVTLLRRGEGCIVYRGNRYFENYRFNELYYQVDNDKPLVDYLRQKNHPVDGVFIKIEGGAKKVFYYDTLIAELDLEKAIGSKEGLDLRRQLIRHRTY